MRIFLKTFKNLNTSSLESTKRNNNVFFDKQQNNVIKLWVQVLFTMTQ